MTLKYLALPLALASLFTALLHAGDWKANYPAPEGKFKSTGSGTYFVLEPGFVLEYSAKGKSLIVTVLDETKVVDGVETRVVEERESEEGALIEVSRNYLAISEKSGDLCYFGEDVDMYENGKVTGHGGSWHSGEKGAHYGVLMPGRPAKGQRYYQEQAEGVAMDRAEVKKTMAKLKTPAGAFKDCIVTEESSPLEDGKASKTYVPGIGLANDGELLLSKVTRPSTKKP